MQQLSDAYWTELNNYDLEALLSLLEENYRVERTKPLQDRVDQLKFFGVKLIPEGVSPPYLTGPGAGEQFIQVGSPRGTSQVRMTFQKLGDDWKITHAEETE